MNRYKPMHCKGEISQISQCWVYHQNMKHNGKDMMESTVGDFPSDRVSFSAKYGNCWEA